MKRGGFGMPVKISIPLQENGKIEVEGEFSYVKETIPHLKELIEALGANVGEINIAPVALGSELDIEERPPPIPVNLKDSPTKVIFYIFTEEKWGLKSRTLNEIKEALAAEGINRDSKFLSATLIQMVQAGKLHRVRDQKSGEWLYSRY